MKYVVRVADSARKDLLGLDPPIRERVLRKIELASKDPDRHFLPLKNDPREKLRVGDYRVLAKVDRRAGTIDVLLVGHRRNIYG